MQQVPAQFENQAIRRLYDDATETGWFSWVGMKNFLTIDEHRFTPIKAQPLSGFSSPSIPVHHRQICFLSPVINGEERRTSKANCTRKELLRNLQQFTACGWPGIT